MGETHPLRCLCQLPLSPGGGEVVTKAAAVLSPCFLHSGQPSPSEGPLHLGPGAGATPFQLYLAQEQNKTCLNEVLCEKT